MRIKPSFILSGLTLLLLFVNCQQTVKQPPDQVKADTSALSGEQLLKYHEVCDSIQTIWGELPALASVCAMAQRIVSFKDSLEIENGGAGSLKPVDSALMATMDKKGYEMILAYKRLASFCLPSSATPEITRKADSKEIELLGKFANVKSSEFFSNRQFFFLGGGPFLARIEGEDGQKVFKDPSGKPEIRYSCNVNENAEYLLGAVSRLKNISADIFFGPPLNSYDMGPQEVSGIGSLIHEFRGRIPLFFITEDGLTAAQLISVKVKLVPESLGCVSDKPEATFACSVVPSGEILGVYIPIDRQPLAECKVIRNRKIWTIDFNHDGTPEMAGLSDTYAGISSDTMIRMTWYININGQWKVIDRAEELDCT